MLEAAFVAWLVTLLGDNALRGASRILLGNRERRAFASALSAATGVAIAAVTREVPDGSREALERALCERFSDPPPVVLDGRTRVRTGLINAVREQIAPLADPGITPAGRSFLEEIGVDATQLADDLVQVAIRSIEQVGPSFPALTPLVTQLNADGILQIEEAVSLRVDDILAAVERWERTAARAPGRPDGRAAAQGGGQPSEISPDAVNRMTDALLEIPSIADNDTRNVILNMLPNQLRDSIPRSPVPRIQAYNVVRTSFYYEHGLRDLVRAVRFVERDSLPMRQLDDLILDIGQDVRADAGADESGLGCSP
jgi:Effector-associated domain 2